MMNGYEKTFVEQGHAFLAQAWTELEAEDLHQASEKGWGAAAQLVKAYAADRGLPHNSHGRLHAAVSRLVAETGDGSMRTLFNEAGGLHSNFYEGGFDIHDIRESLEQVGEFVDRVSTLLNGH